MRDKKRLIKDYDPSWMVAAFANHIQENSAKSFAGAYNIRQTALAEWVKTIPEMAEINRQYLLRIYAKKRSFS